MKRIPFGSLSVLVVLCASATAGAQTTDGTPDTRVPLGDPTGGAYTPPTSLFIPAAALPTLNVRMTVGADIQPIGSFDAVRPLVRAELGLGRGFTVAAGSSWFGGDRSSTIDGLTPYAQVRYQLFGSRDGMGWQGGVALTGKRVGWHNGDAEMEASFSVQYRARRWEVGAQGTFGQSLVDAGEHDLEARAFAAWRVIPSFAVGVAAQLRVDVGNESPALEAMLRARGLAEVDMIGGAMASYTYERWQVGALAGVSTIGLYENAGFIGQGFGSVRF
jgi:hypothetical protein